MHSAHDYFHEIPRITRAGLVASTPYPYLAMLAEADGRYEQLMQIEQYTPEWLEYRQEVRGILVCVSIIHRDTIEELGTLLYDRYIARLNGLPVPEYVKRREEAMT